MRKSKSHITNLKSQALLDDKRADGSSPADVSLLVDAELLAFIISAGAPRQELADLCRHILERWGGLRGLLWLKPENLEKLPGLSRAEFSRLHAVTELFARVTAYPPDERPLVTEASAAAQLVCDMGDLPQEHVRVILLDASRRVMSISTVYIGTLNALVLRAAEVYREAIIHNSPAMILVHNHPTGDPAPSPEDVEITRTLIAAGKMLDIQLLDHLIIGRHGWVSLREMGLAF